MAYAAVTWEIDTADDATVAAIDTDVNDILSDTDPEALTERTVIFDSDPVDLVDLMQALDDVCDDHPELRWVIFNMRERTRCEGWVLTAYDEERGHDITGSGNYPDVRGRRG